MSIKQKRIERREKGKCDSPSLQWFGSKPIHLRNGEAPRQLSKLLKGKQNDRRN